MVGVRDQFTHLLTKGSYMLKMYLKIECVLENRICYLKCWKVTLQNTLRRTLILLFAVGQSHVNGDQIQKKINFMWYSKAI